MVSPADTGNTEAKNRHQATDESRKRSGAGRFRHFASVNRLRFPLRLLIIGFILSIRRTALRFLHLLLVRLLFHNATVTGTLRIRFGLRFRFRLRIRTGLRIRRRLRFRLGLRFRIRTRIRLRCRIRRRSRFRVRLRFRLRSRTRIRIRLRPRIRIRLWIRFRIRFRIRTGIWVRLRIRFRIRLRIRLRLRFRIRLTRAGERKPRWIARQARIRKDLHTSREHHHHPKAQ
jgi:hypothetical protein